MLQKGLDELTVGDLKSLIVDRVAENRRLEYKRRLYGGKDQDKAEAAADLSAMANGVGGTLILGIAEENGCASELVGVESSDPDSLLRSIQDSLRSGIEPTLHGVQIKWVPIEDKRGAVVIHIPRSWYGPHRVILNKNRNFYIRDENGKHPMSVEELRRAFVAGTTIPAEIRDFRDGRISLLERDYGPLEIRVGTPKLVVHVVPYMAFIEPTSFDIRDSIMLPFGSGFTNCFPSVEGKVFYIKDKIYGSTSVQAFSTLFRDGRVEAVTKIDSMQFSLARAEMDIISAFRETTRIFDDIGVSPPYAVMVSFLDVKNCYGVDSRHSSSTGYPCRRDRLLLPSFEITNAELGCKTPDTMFPLATLLWNAFGYEASPNFDQEGRYNSPYPDYSQRIGESY